MMSTQRHCWAPLVYGRTLNVDFRLLATPEGLSREDLEWCRRHIYGTTIYADELREGHRWALFKNERCCVFGLTCMASLVSTHNVIVASRELYLFAGYVAQIDPQAFPAPPHHPPVPGLAAMDRPPFAVFRTLYDYVDFLWEDDRTTLEAAEIAEDIEKPYREVPQLERILSTRKAPPRPAAGGRLNRDAGRIRLAPHRPEGADGSQALWAEAVAATGPVSLCLGLPDRSAALRGPYLNVTVRGAERVDVLERTPETASHSVTKEAAQERRARVSLRQDQATARAPATDYETYAVKFINVMRDLTDESAAGNGAGGDWIDYDSPSPS